MSPRTVIAGVLRGRRPVGATGSALDASQGRPVPIRTPEGRVAPPGTVWVEPLPGPLSRRPEVDRRTAAAMLLAAAEGLPMGPADTALIARYTDVLDPGDTAILASLFARARIAGPSVWTTTAGDVEAAGFLPICAACRLRLVTDPVSLAEAGSLARTHDVVHHVGVWTCEVVSAAQVGGGTR